MVCEGCQKKLDKLIVPDKWKEGARNTTKGDDGGRKLGVNMLLEKKKFKYNPFASKCKTCKAVVENEAQYCHTCAYTKGVCSMCGVKVLNTKFYRQSTV
mmetsp:Transcript_21318/g.24777  ORF Transcript_21318/g.24777 Transcript_21318/m.24777 type:complete len:99 (+) Transcript_21318:26-322(+)